MHSSLAAWVTARPARITAWMCMAQVLCIVGFSTWPTLIPVLQPAWGLTNAEAGFISGMFFGGYMLLVPPLSALTDRIDARHVYMVSGLTGALGLAGMVFAEGLVAASICQGLVGAGVAGMYMPGLRALSDNLGASGQHPGTQSRATAFYTAIFGLGTSVSILIAGSLAHDPDLAFIVSAFGPLLAAVMVGLGLPPRRPRPPVTSRHLLDFRPVLAQREVRPWMFGYGVHCWELFGSRSWLVAFLSFAAAASLADGAPAGEAGTPLLWGVIALAPATVAAVANVLGPPASVLGNEAALRWGRVRVVCIGMGVSALVTALLGFASPLPWAWVVALAALHMALIMTDSSAQTAAVVQFSAPATRGATLALHSTLGFGAGFVSPLVFGLVLDVAGGNRSALAWGAGFVSLALPAAIYAVWLARRR